MNIFGSVTKAQYPGGFDVSMELHSLPTCGNATALGACAGVMLPLFRQRNVLLSNGDKDPLPGVMAELEWQCNQCGRRVQL